MDLLLYIETQFIPEYIQRMQSKGYTHVNAYAEPIGIGINIVITNAGKWVNEFCVTNVDGQLLYIPVIRTA
jgi:hypothetical protein